MDVATAPDLLDEGFYADLEAMHATLTWLRANDPVYRDPTTGFVGVTRHADIIDVERRAQVYLSSRGYRSSWAPDEDNMIAQDDPRHAEQRRLVARRLTPRGVAGDEEPLRRLVNELLDEFADGGVIDVVDALAAQLASRTTATLLGFPESRWRDLQSWSERVMRIDSIPRDPTGAVMSDVLAAITEFKEYLDDAVPRLRDEPDGSFLSVWANASLGGCPMSEHTIINETGLFIAGGAETTRTAIARGLRIFCDHPDQWDRLGADPTLVTTAVEEVLRWVSPLNQMFRTAAVDDEIGGVPISEGDRIALLYPSANRDEAVFADPFRFDITRSPNPHVAFGFGPHVCIGQSFARLSLQTVFGEMARRFTDLRVVTEPVIERNIFAGSVQRFDLALARRA